MEKKLKVLVALHDHVYAYGFSELARVLDDRFEIICLERRGANFVNDVINSLEALRPDVVIVNTFDEPSTKSKGARVAYLIQEVKRILPETKIVVLSSYIHGEEYLPVKLGLADLARDSTSMVDELLQEIYERWGRPTDA